MAEQQEIDEELEQINLCVEKMYLHYIPASIPEYIKYPLVSGIQLISIMPIMVNY